MSEPPAVLTVQEVADLLCISHWSVAAMTRDGRLPRVPGLRRTCQDRLNKIPFPSVTPLHPATRARPVSFLGLGAE